MNNKVGNAKVFIMIAVIAILIAGAIMLRAIKNSSYLPAQQSNTQGNVPVASQNVDLTKETQSLDSSDQDLNSMDSSLNQLDADSSSF